MPLIVKCIHFKVLPRPRTLSAKGGSLRVIRSHGMNRGRPMGTDLGMNGIESADSVCISRIELA
jgi:hypothetical protein